MSIEYFVTTSDGKKYEVTGPDASTASEAIARVERQYPGSAVVDVQVQPQANGLSSAATVFKSSETSAATFGITESVVKGAIVGGVLAAVLFLGIFLWRIARRAGRKGIRAGARVVEQVRDRARTAQLPDASDELDEFYLAALQEVESGQADPACWAKAFAHASGDSEKARALYIRYRIEKLRPRI